MNFMYIMEFIEVRDSMANLTAKIISENGARSTPVEEAWSKVKTVLCNRQQSDDVQAVVFPIHRHAAKDANHFVLMDSVLTATRRYWGDLEEILTSPEQFRSDKPLEYGQIIERGPMRIFLGCEWANRFDKDSVPSKGIYIFVSHLKPSTVERLGLRPLPYSNSSVVLQVEEPEDPVAPSPTVDNDRKAVSDREADLDKDSIAWRSAFVSRIRCLSAEEVAEEVGNEAANRSALASRWTAEKKIFSIRHANRTLYPKFQFRDGSPIPSIAKILKIIPEHYTGWDKAFFFTMPNSYLDGKRPFEVLTKNPDRVIAAAEVFAHPADAF
jgi:hypothetical protein